MTVIYIGNGNMFNAEMVIKDYIDHEGHRMLANELLTQRNEMLKMLEDLVENGKIFFDKDYEPVENLLTKVRGKNNDRI